MKKTNKSNSSKGQVSADHKAATVQETTMSKKETKITVTQKQLDAMVQAAVAKAAPTKEKRTATCFINKKVWADSGKFCSYDVAVKLEDIQAAVDEAKAHGWKSVYFRTWKIFDKVVGKK